MLLIRNKKLSNCESNTDAAKIKRNRRRENKSFSPFDASENGLAAIQRCLQNQYGCYWLRNKINGQVIRWESGKKKETKLFASTTIQDENGFWQHKTEIQMLIYCDSRSIHRHRDFYQTKNKTFLHILHWNDYIQLNQQCVFEATTPLTVKLSWEKKTYFFPLSLSRLPWGSWCADHSFRFYIHEYTFIKVFAKFQ